MLRTNILLDCTGLTSRPFIPRIRGQETFTGLTIHQKEFGQHEQGILSPINSDPQQDSKQPTRKHIVVLGGAKSAADVVYACARDTDLSVSWVIREDGNGPAALITPRNIEMFYTRFVSSFLPCIFGARSWVEGLLHRTSVGRWVVRRIWRRLDRRYRADAGFQRRAREQVVGGDNGRGFPELECETP